MTSPVPDPPLPIQPPPPLESYRTSRRIYVLLVVSIAIGAAAATASVITGRATFDFGNAQQDDVLRNREYLQSTCENTRAVTEAFTTATPAPCPTPEP